MLRDRSISCVFCVFFFQAEDGIRDHCVTGVQTCALPISKTFTLHYPADYTITELANQDVEYAVSVKSLKRRVLPALDDEFAKDMGDFDSLAALRARVREDLEHEAKHAGERDLRSELMKQLA